MKAGRAVLVVLIAAAVAAAGCTSSGPAPQSPGRTARSVPLPSPAAIPAVAQVTCDPGARVLTPKVAAQADGVHVRIDNRTDTTSYFRLDHLGAGKSEPGELGSSGDLRVPRGSKIMVWIIPPGPAAVSCVGGGDVTPAPIRILDPAHGYVPIEIPSCGAARVTTYQVYFPLEFDHPDEPVEIVRERMRGLKPDDVVERAGYPEQSHAWVRVLRDDRVVALVNFGPIRWSTVSVCVDSGIRPKR